MKKVKLLLFFIFLGVCVSAQIRREISIPNIDGYVTLKCDFHIHTMFSDGSVMPAIRVDEAFGEGLDGIAITDHIEHRPNIKSGLINADHNKSYSMAAASGKADDIIVIKGCEITRGMPPGHWNAIFIKDANAIETPEYKDAIKAAIDQGGFTFWNHPGWERQAPDTTVWLKEHTELYNLGYMKGIEVANTNHYFPEAQNWALEKNLTMLGNSDMHSTNGLSIDFLSGAHRTITLVFAKERSAAGIREALDNQRTAVYYRGDVIGREPLLKELFKESLKVKSVKRTEKEIRINMENVSDLTFNLSKGKHDMNLNYFRDVLIKPHSFYTITVSFKKPTTEAVSVDFVVDDFLVAPNKGLDVSIKVPAYKKR